jgi:CBS domain containing-hemolysin-like protein
VFALDENITIKEIIQTKEDIFKFSRIPVYHDSIEDVVGIVMTKHIFKQALIDDSVTLGTIKKDIFSINENIPVSKALDLFIKKKDHMFLVIDNYDQTEGIITLEDCVETILGVEIVDESDSTVDMRELAKLKMKQKRKAKNIQ